jgi:hypothetical protein
MFHRFEVEPASVCVVEIGTKAAFDHNLNGTGIV